MTVSLGVQPWMTTPQVVAVFDALEARGRRGCARYVGGCVRNTLLGAPIGDIDIATTLTPDLVAAALKSAGIKAIPTGIEHGTITAVVDGEPFEVTTLRRDVSTDGRRASVAFTMDWALDAERRDFTLNSIYADRDGEIFDPTGRGVADAKAGAIVFVGDAKTRIAEDSLRILRFFRFLAWYGRGVPDAEAVEACKVMAATVASLPAERTSKELLKLLEAADPKLAIDLMAETGVLRVILPQAKDRAVFDTLAEIETKVLGRPDPVLRFAALLPRDPVVARQAAETLRLSNAERDRLTLAAQRSPEIDRTLDPKGARRLVYRLGKAAFADQVKLAWAYDSTGDASAWRALLDLAEQWALPVLPVNGADAVQAGLSRGPLIGKVLADVEAWWIDNDFAPTKPAALEKLAAVVKALGEAP